jgi:uncharacterized cupredoxin-like copper-binding protein
MREEEIQMQDQTRRISLITSGALIAFLALFLLIAACSDDDDDADPTATTPPDSSEPQATEPSDTEPPDSETTVDTSLTEFEIALSVESAAPGTVTFNASSDGAIFHNLRVVATDLDPDALPTNDSTFTVDESELDVVGSTDDLDPGESEELTVDLPSGSYVLICNIPTHYDAGMSLAFEVE